ncbi:hypothetical protein BDB01DRAFT_729151 [Pilobolus umbonatus]|nr:hypothetical protein BDB01DRAFT_729151 [Pilobolus umbonatus]
MCLLKTDNVHFRPGKAGFKGDKTPTVCVYNTQNSQLVEWGHSAVRYWTDNAKKNEHYRKYEKFKLKLKGSAPQQGRTIDVTGNDEKNFHLKATVDYLKAIHDFTCQMVNIQNVNGVTLEKEKTRYLLTVPTQWSDDTRDVMRIIAREAGLITDEDHDNKLLVINESFASTIFCEREPFDDDPMEIYLSENNKARFKETDKYLIVDAGGGTVDLATYECTGPMPNSAERLNGRCQLTVDGGDECGSKFIDDKMLDILLNHLFKNRDPTKTSQTEAYTEYLYPIMTEFINNIKVCLYCPDNKNILIDVEDKSILISKSYIRDVIFEPVVEKTIEEITKQVMKANKAIKKTFLLGGFGLSPYLKQRILMSFRKDANGNRSIGKLIQCIKGAVHHGLDLKSFTHRLSRRTYAINVKGFVPKDTDVFGELRKSYHVSEDLFTPKQYKKEAARVLISDKRVVLGHQPNYQSSKAFDFDHEKEDNRMIPIIRKNVKITDENETKGIYRRFYAYEECVVYASK